VFDQIRKLFGEIVDSVTDPGPDLTAFPPVVLGQDLASVAPEVIAGYVGQKVLNVEPLTRLGTRSGNGLGRKLQERILGVQARAAAVISGDEAPKTPQEQAMRDSGRADAFAQMQAEGAAAAAELQPNSWTVNCEGGKRATIQLFPIGDDAVQFENMKSTEANQRTMQGASQQHNSWTIQHVRQLMEAPYESYYQPGMLVARGQSHDALVQGIFGTGHDYESLAGLAALACSVEGRPPQPA